MRAQSARVVQLDNALPRDKWIKRIATAWQEQLSSIFETGALLEASRAELKHGEWTALFQSGELPFSIYTAQRLIAISQNDNVRNAAHALRLPVRWATLYELTRLTDEQFEDGIKSGAINPEMQRKDVNALRGIEPEEKKTPRAMAVPDADNDDDDDDAEGGGVGDTAPGKPNNAVIKFCNEPREFFADFNHRIQEWLASRPDLGERDRGELASSLQFCADGMSRLAMSLR